jgi:hypothetical protein
MFLVCAITGIIIPSLHDDGNCHTQLTRWRELPYQGHIITGIVIHSLHDYGNYHIQHTRWRELPLSPYISHITKYTGLRQFEKCYNVNLQCFYSTAQTLTFDISISTKMDMYHYKIDTTRCSRSSSIFCQFAFLHM